MLFLTFFLFCYITRPLNFAGSLWADAILGSEYVIVDFVGIFQSTVRLFSCE